MPSPLSELYKSPNDLPILTFPPDLGSARKGHYISFTVMVPNKSNYNTKTSSVPASVISPSIASSPLTNAMNSIGNAATEAAGAVSGVASTIGAVAGVANQAVGAVNSAVGAVSGVVGSVAGVAGIASSAIGQGSVLGGITAATVGISAATNLVSGVGGTLGSVGQFLSNPTESISNLYDSVSNYFNSTADKVSAIISGENSIAPPILFEPATTKITGFINLYMPDTISMNQLASYGDISATEALGNFGLGKEVVEQGKYITKNFDSIYSGIKESVAKGNGIGSSLRNLGSSLGNATPAAGLEMFGNLASASGLVGEKFSTYLLGQNNYATNPQMEVLFTQMEFRTFHFDFTFTPKSEDEAATVREIIKMFRAHAAPEIDKSGSGRYFIVPSIFNIEYRYLENMNENLHKFAPCALQSIIVDYAPEVGWVAHNDGMPVKTRLTLHFKEMEILDKTKIKEGY